MCQTKRCFSCICVGGVMISPHYVGYLFEHLPFLLGCLTSPLKTFVEASFMTSFLVSSTRPGYPPKQDYFCCTKWPRTPDRISTSIISCTFECVRMKTFQVSFHRPIQQRGWNCLLFKAPSLPP